MIPSLKDIGQKIRRWASANALMLLMKACNAKLSEYASRLEVFPNIGNIEPFKGTTFDDILGRKPRFEHHVRSVSLRDARASLREIFRTPSERKRRAINEIEARSSGQHQRFDLC